MIFKVPITQELIDSEFANVVLNGTKEEVAFYAQFVSNPNIPDNRYGRLPIWVAIEGEEAYEKTKIVLSLNPDINVKNINGQTPVMVALEKRMQGIGTLLLKHPTLDITITDKQKNDLMKYAVLSRSPKAVIEAAKRGVPLDTPDILGYTPAYYSVQNEDLDVFKALCISGLKQNESSSNYHQVITLAQKLAHSEHSLTWIHATRHGIFDDIKLTPLTQDWQILKKRLFKLSDSNRFRISKMLEINLNDPLFYPPQYIQKTPEQLLAAALIEQCRYGTPMDVALLLNIGADPNMRDKMGRTPLFCAVSYRGRVEDKQTAAQVVENAYRKVQLLLENGANPNLPNLICTNTNTIPDITPLEQSLIENRSGICSLLIKGGADILQSSAHRSLIHFASAHCHSQIVDILACAKAPLTEPDKNNITPLEYAITNNKPYTVCVLRSHLIAQGQHALFDITTDYGKKLHRMASEHGDTMIEAMTGTLTLPPTNQTQNKSPATFQEKIAALSSQKLKLLATLAGLSIGFEPENTLSSATAYASPVIERWTPFRMALAAFKREHRKKR